MAERTDLQSLLEALLGSKAVYFQPPPTVTMTYPCLIYQRSNLDTKFANNSPYSVKKQYTITLIDSNPDSVILDKLAALPACSFNRHFKADNLNHDVFSIYF
jgi:hypothetical protein